MCDCHMTTVCALSLSPALSQTVLTQFFFFFFFWSLGKHSKTHFKTALCLPWPHWKTIRAHRGEVGGWVGVRWGWGVSTNAWGVSSTWKRTVWDSKRPFFSIEFFPQCILFKQRQLTPLNRLRSCRPCGLWTYNFFFFQSLSHVCQFREVSSGSMGKSVHWVVLWLVCKVALCSFM